MTTQLTPDQPEEERPLFACPACGCLNTPGHYFCNECGGTLPTPAELEAAAETEAEPDSDPRPISRWTRLGRSPYWYGNLFLLILLGLCGGLIILRLSAPDQFRKLAEALWVPGRRIALPLLDALPGKWIDRAFGLEPTPSPEPSSDDPSDTGSQGSPSETKLADSTSGQGGAQVVVSGWSSVNVRSGPGTGYDVLGKAKANSHYPATGILVDGSWCRIEFQGQPAWIACYLANVRLLRVDEVPYVTHWRREEGPSP